MIVYDRVAKSIGPKKTALAEAELRLSLVMDELAKKQSDLKGVLERVASLNKTLEETQKRKSELENMASKARKQIDRAGQLINGLAAEKIRWTDSADRLRASAGRLE